ncbi:hypothetical protein F8E02_06710 [Methanoculleus sp. Wushi-C6]|uniref:Uncharacterized protein n=1 Tax=Methanoculleus caldifontis TaxID=2651577 RepID=A0ABU3X1Q2_9EURY|nr:hypothetical protein [Methanoculleus sp. Wushi-C6]MDV2481700.1 hypothetical protein [Methanoculleus sp. Wushi-C6]
MKASISRLAVLLLALVCIVQAASAAAGFEVKTETINPASGNLEPGQQVTVRYVLTYELATINNANDETFEFSTGLSNPSWDFTIYRDGVTIPIPKRSGYYPVLTEYEFNYGDAETQLDVQLRGTVPSGASSKIEVVKIQQKQGDTVRDTHSVVRDVVSKAQVEGSLSTQQNNLKALKADLDAKAAQGVDTAAAQAKYEAANQALVSAASASPSQAASYLTTASKAMDESKVLLDKAWTQKEVANAAEKIESLDGMITNFVENRSMGSDPQVVAIMTKRESAVQFYSQAKDALNANNNSLARSKAADATNKANEALTDANRLQEKISQGFSLSGDFLLYIGVGIVLVLVIVGVVIYRRKTGWDELG